MGYTVEPTALITAGCRFFPGTISFGEGCYVNTDVFFDTAAPISIGANVSVGFGVKFVTSSHEIGPSNKRAGPHAAAPISVEDGAWIGAGALILPGVTIASGCVIAAGSVVTRDTKDDGLYGGVPARRLRDLNHTD